LIAGNNRGGEVAVLGRHPKYAEADFASTKRPVAV